MTSKHRYIRKADSHDTKRIMELLEHGRQKMRANGNTEQWTNGNPKLELVENDIKEGNGYIIEENGEIIATFAFIMSNCPAVSISHIHDCFFIFI